MQDEFGAFFTEIGLAKQGLIKNPPALGTGGLALVAARRAGVVPDEIAGGVMGVLVVGGNRQVIVTGGLRGHELAGDAGLDRDGHPVIVVVDHSLAALVKDEQLSVEGGPVAGG